MTEKEIERLRHLSLPVLIGNFLYIELTKEFTDLFCKIMEQAEERLNQSKESDGNPMKHNVTISKSENRVIEEYYVMRAVKDDCDIAFNRIKKVFKERELDHNPTIEEIAQFLSDTGADFVSVEHNYRFEPDLPFC